MFGQGKTATTILTDSGYHYPVIHEPYSQRVYYKRDRSTSVPLRVAKGNRPMHRTTLTIAKPPWSPDYDTTHKQYFSGSQTLDPPIRPSRCRSMHTSKITFGTDNESDSFLSDHMVTYKPTGASFTSPPYLVSIENKLNQIEGAKVKEAISPDKGPQSFWSQYNRTYNKLGVMRGPGVGREYPVRQQYDIITGEEKSPDNKPSNARVSGNRVLHNCRQQLNTQPFLF
uniref:Uncharacterized protein n=1 Tax=Arion vulgaris TaxID=1028688 RepID=A0A0B6ZC06_9EUPU